MAEPTLTEVFGTGATQDASTLTISKSALASVGLTPGANNTAESLLASLVLLAREQLTQANFDANLDQSLTVIDGFASIVQRDDGTGNLVNYRQSQLTVALHNLDSFSVDPNNF